MMPKPNVPAAPPPSDYRNHAPAAYVPRADSTTTATKKVLTNNRMRKPIASSSFVIAPKYRLHQT